MAGVEYLHSRDPPICHGDLKSVRQQDRIFLRRLKSCVLQLNILVNSECRAIVSDFGSARVIDWEEGKRSNQKENRTPLKANTTSENHADVSISICPSESTVTLSGFVWSLRWAAPELLADETPTLASDIWALGMICLEVGFTMTTSEWPTFVTSSCLDHVDYDRCYSVSPGHGGSCYTTHHRGQASHDNRLQASGSA